MSPLAVSLSDMLKVDVTVCEKVLERTNNDMNEAGMLIVSHMDDLSSLVSSLMEEDEDREVDNDDDDDDDDKAQYGEFTYQFRDGMSWIDYRAEDQKMLRSAFSQGETTVTLGSGYEVTMTQTEKFQINKLTRKRRQVRRVRKAMTKNGLQDLIGSSHSKDVKIKKLHEIMLSQNLNPKDLETPDAVDPTFVAKSLSELRRESCNILECIALMRKCACADVLRFGLLILRNHVMRNQNMLLKAVAGLKRAPEVVFESVRRFQDDRTYSRNSLS